MASWLAHLEGRGAPPVADAASALAWLVDAVSELFGAVARPIVVVLDDLQWADPRSVELLAALAPQLHRMPALVVGTYRDDERDIGSLDVLKGVGRALRLDRLGRGALRAFAEVVTGGEEVDVDWLLARTGGNPLFAREVLRAPARSVPPTVAALLGERLSTLSDHAREVVEAAAVIGEEFDLGLLAEVVGGSAGDLGRLLDEAARCGFVEPALVPHRYRFTHGIAREAAVEALSAARRWRWHEAAAAALVARRNAGGEVDAAVLAHHFSEAGCDHVLQAVAHTREAAAAAMRDLAATDAVGLLDRAARLLDDGWHPSERLAVLIELGHARHAAGDVAGSHEAFESATRLAQARNDVSSWGRAALGLAGADGFEVPVLDRDRLAGLEEVAEALGDTAPELRARILARMAVGGTYVLDDAHRLHVAEEAVAVARPAGGVALLEALAAYCDAVAGPSHARRRVELASEIIDLAAAAGDHRRELLGRRLRAVALLEVGDVVGFDTEVEGFARTASRVRQPLYDWYVPLWRGARALMAGHFAAVEEQIAEVERIGTAAGSENALLLAAVQRWWLRTCQGRAEDALKAVDAALASSPAPPIGGEISRALALANADRNPEARVILDRLLPGELALAPVDAEWVPMLCEAALAVHRVGGHPHAKWLYESLLPYRDLYLVEGIGACCLGSVEAFLALVAREAPPHTERARAANERIGLTAAVVPPPTATATLRRRGDTWEIGWNAVNTPVRDRKGLHDLATLVRRPHQPVHVLELVGGGEVGASAEARLDAKAVASYRRRLADIEAALDAADQRGDHRRSQTLAAEKDILVRELRTSRGLAGRDRPIRNSDTERARSAVTQRIRDTLRALEPTQPDFAAHLHATIKTGTYCVYEPDHPVAWTL